MYNVKMDLQRDWIATVKEVFRGSGHALAEELTDEGVAEQYFLQTLPVEQAIAAARSELKRLRDLEQTIRDNLDTVIVPDIRKRTGYQGDAFEFSWVFNQGEHIVEMRSEYRIPLQ